MVLALLVAIAAMASGARAQDTTRAPRDSLGVRRDSLRTDTLRTRADSLAAERQRALERERADSIKPPLARPALPVVTTLGPAPAWDRDGIPASGALTLGELVEGVPGVTMFRTGWIASPEQAAFLGQFGRVRVFYDGVELDPLDPRTGGIADLSFLDLWNLEHALVESSPGEVRVHLRSWNVRSTTPVTRVDVYTGDLETNVYRGLFGRRLRRGQVLQLGASQYGTTDVRNQGDADNTTLWGRLGWASPRWSIDASIDRTSRDRREQLREEPLANLPRLDGASTLAYGRVAYGNPDEGVWAQAIAASQSFVIHGPPVILHIDSIPGPGGGGPGGSPPDTTFGSGDSTTTRPQYIVTGGVSRGPLRLTGTARLRRVEGATKVTTEARLGYVQGPLSLSLLGERAPNDNLLRTEVQARWLLRSWLAVNGGISRFSPVESGSAPTSVAVRGEVGLRLGRLWATGGIIRRDTAALPAPIVFDTTFRGAAAGQTTATFGTLRGKFYRDIGLDVVAVRYQDAGAFRPQYEVSSRLYLDSDMRARFPSGNLNILLALTHEYRTQALFPTSSAEALSSTQYRVWGMLVEVRLLTATLTYQYRNFMDELYQQVPGFPSPRYLNYYGVRWNFFN